MRPVLTSLCILAILSSCEKNAPVSGSNHAPSTNPILAAAQLALGKKHLGSGSPLKALPYLEASLANNPLPKTKRLLTETLASTPFSVPTIQLDHPFPVAAIATFDTSIIAAIGGPFPTLLRWEISPKPKITSILFPQKNNAISHLILSPSGKYLLMQRGSHHLLCDAESLKPISLIEPLPPFLNPQSILTFLNNSLLLAHPAESSNNTLTWHIRDCATGEILRSETINAFPRPTHTYSISSTLYIALEDNTSITIPIRGEVKKSKSQIPKKNIPDTDHISFSGNSITLHTPIPASSSTPLELLTGFRLEQQTQTLVPLPPNERVAHLSLIHPNLPSSLLSSSAEQPLLTRLSIAFPYDFPNLTSTQQELTERVYESFNPNDIPSTLSFIPTLPDSGLPIATALYLACEAEEPELVQAVVNHARNLPDSLKHLALGSHKFDDVSSLRGSQDWLGYEYPDFISLFESLRNRKIEILSSLALSEKPDSREINDLYKRLIDPSSRRKLGQQAISQAANIAALSLSRSKQHANESFKFAIIAETTGSHPSNILRIRASAFTTLADFKNALPLWINLISNQPETTHVPSDYSDAAYTAFEINNADQAIEILNTGVFRFPRDVSLSIRAGQIAIMTNYPEQAVRFLTHSTSLGIPPEEIENTTALLAVAHSQIGDHENALAYLTQLEAIDNSWTDLESIGKLPWPHPLIDTLRNLILSRAETIPALLPESDLIDTVPLPEEFPIPEPDLPE